MMCAYNKAFYGIRDIYGCSYLGQNSCPIHRTTESRHLSCDQHLHHVCIDGICFYYMQKQRMSRKQYIFLHNPEIWKQNTYFYIYVVVNR